MTTAFDLLQEMQTWVDVPESLLENAKKAKINESNNAEFATLLDDWCSGVYDNDPDQVVNEIEFIINNA